MDGMGGVPDVVDVDQVTGEVIFFDFCPESPAGHSSLRCARVSRMAPST